MASVPNRVYPMNEYREIITDKITSTGTGSFFVAAGSRLKFSTVYTLPPSGSMDFGELAVVTGSGGTSATIYLKIKSGSGNAIYKLDLTYVSSGSA